MIGVKICGISEPIGLQAAVSGGARWVGFVFYAHSPRAVDPAIAAVLARAVPSSIRRVGLFVDADDQSIGSTLEIVPLDVLQLHGRETPDRVFAVRKRFGLDVVKAIPVGGTTDVEAALAYEGAANSLLFDARPPAGARAPGGNARSFEWRLLRSYTGALEWMLAGGLTVGNLAKAVRQSGARAVDVSSGVEVRPGEKDPALIVKFLETAATIDAFGPPLGSDDAGSDDDDNGVVHVTDGGAMTSERRRG